MWSGVDVHLHLHVLFQISSEVLDERTVGVHFRGRLRGERSNRAFRVLPPYLGILSPSGLALTLSCSK